MRNEIKSLHDQLAESKNGLLAASRITDQLESCQVANATLKTECEYFESILRFTYLTSSEKHFCMVAVKEKCLSATLHPVTHKMDRMQEKGIHKT